MPPSSTCSNSSMSTQSRSRSSNSSCSSVTSRTLKRLRERSFTPRDDYSDDDEEAPKRRRYTDGPTNSLLLACPFSKNFPAKRRELRACMTGWPSIPRLKQHLARCHAPKISCRRCHESFKTEQDLDLHSQANIACTPLPIPKRDETRMTASAQHILNRRTPKGESSERAWKYFYRIIFPEVPEELIPSPYLNITEDEVSFIPQDAARELWKRLYSTLPRIIEEETRDIILSVSSHEVVARLLARISKTMGEFLGTKEEKGYRDNFFCSSTPNGDADLFEHSTCKSTLELLSSYVHQPLKESASQCFMAGIHPESEANFKSLQPFSTTSHRLEAFQSDRNFPCVFFTAPSSWKPSDSYESIVCMKHNQYVPPAPDGDQYAILPPVNHDNEFDVYWQDVCHFSPQAP